MRPTRSGPSRRRSDGCRAASGRGQGATVRSPPEAPRLRTPSCPESTYRIAYGPHPTARVPPPRNKRTDSKGRQRPRRSNRAYLARDVREIPLHRAPPPFALTLSLLFRYSYLFLACPLATFFRGDAKPRYRPDLIVDRSKLSRRHLNTN
ncbi:hypothetical protein OPV22_028499 [Ensete ventricosum]|uniref:Uncharacterized protein n=1 Tax=Ensete ventricosum TaxID=4639 RepID=A0AAV8P452_ENSVE|nr:hypothetical protein OPV22_028499 [Ensete ventricosum]